jgi:hypothetical protein
MSNIIASPGVQFNEIDFTINSRVPNNNTVFMTGFANQGPVYEPVYITTLAEYEQIFGAPTNSAERYLFHSARQILQKTQSQLLITRLPYEIPNAVVNSNNERLNHSVLIYPLSASIVDEETGVPDIEASTSYTLLEPVNVLISQDQYDNFLQNNFDWTRTVYYKDGNDYPVGLVITNDIDSSVNNLFEGFYVGIADNSKTDPSYGFDCITGIKVMDSTIGDIDLRGYTGVVDRGYLDWINISPERLSFKLSESGLSAGVQDTVSEIVLKYPKSYPFSDDEFNDSLIITLFSLKKSIYETTNVQLANTLLEGYMGSVNANKKRVGSEGGAPKSVYLEDLINNPSPYLSVFINPALSHQDWEDTTTSTAASLKTIRVSDDAKNLYALGVHNTINANDTKLLGYIPGKLDIALRLIEAPDQYPLDITCDAGLSTIWTAIACKNPDAQTIEYGAGDITVADTTFNDEHMLGYSGTVASGPSVVDLQGSGGANNPNGQYIITAHSSIASMFDQFASQTRKDHIHISDPLRHIFVEGANFKKVLRKPSTNTGAFSFSNEIYWPVAHLYSKISTSYTTTYLNWFNVPDYSLRRNIWIPPSGPVAANIINSSPFQAPAGFSRGVITGVADVAISPNQKQRDIVYRVSLNPITIFPGEGIVVYGQKTLLNKPSAFDRLNVRRTFLYLEKSTMATVKYFVHEPNTFITRSRVVASLDPIYSAAKAGSGIYDYKIVCDERNNTPNTIDNNQLIVDIYVKPTRTAEFILVNFYATRTDQDFNELING